MSVDLESSRPLVVTSVPELRAELERVCAAAGLVPDVAPDLDVARAGWRRAPVVLVGPDAVNAAAADRSGAGVDVAPRRSGVLLAAWADESAAVWRAAVAVHADDVVVLPEQRDRLAALLAELTDGTREGVVVAVIGARGGVGASTVAASLARVAAERTSSVLLVDADPEGGGIDLLMGCESEPGLRWPDLADVRGRVGAGALRSALPQRDGVAILSWTPAATTPLPDGATAALLTSARRGTDLVVVDLPRHPRAEAASAIACVDTVLVVVRPDVRAVAGASRLADRIGSQCADVRACVVGSPTARERIEDALAMPVIGCLTASRRTERAIADGLGPELRRRDSRRLSGWLDDLLRRAAR